MKFDVLGRLRALRGWLFDGVRQLATRRGLLTLAGILALVYSLAVLGYVQSVPDLGIKSTFSPVVKGVPQNVIAEDPELRPANGDRVLRVGDLPITTWPDLLLAPVRLHHRLAATPAGAFPREWAKTSSDQRADGVLVRVVFRRERQAGQPPVDFAAWCNLDPPHLDELAPSLLWFCLKLTLFMFGALVMWKRPNDRAATQFFLLCVVTLGAYMGGYHWTHIATTPVLLIGFIVSGVLLPPVSLHFYLVFPRPKERLVQQPRRTLLAVYGLPVLVLMVLLGLYGAVRWLFHHHAPPGLLEEVFGWLLSATYVSLGVSAAWYVASVLALVHSYRTIPDPTERNQVKWILGGALVSLAPIGYSLYLAVFQPDRFGAGAATWPMFAASACVTAAFIISITRYRLMELDQLVSASVVYFFLAGLVYYALIFLGTLAFNQVIAGPRLSEAVRVSTTALVLLLVLDLARSRLRRALDRRFSREKYHLDRTLQRLGEAVQQLVDPPTLLQRLLQASAELLGVSRGAVYLQDGSVYRLAGTLGLAPPASELPADSPLAEALRAGRRVTTRLRVGMTLGPAQQTLQELGGEVAHALSHEGRLLALLVLGPKEHTPYREEDLNLLAAFAQITALALAGAAGHKEIEVLRDDLQGKVEKIAEQQRRILALQSQLRKQWAGTRSQASGLRSQETAVGGQRWAVGRQGGSSGAGTGSALPAAHDGPPSEPALTLAPGIVGSSASIRHLLGLVRKVAETDEVVLIRGESGTGKELLAQAIYEASPRAGKPFIKVHCAALSPTLLESELFGHVKGAFTGAISNKTGRFEAAHGGTIFLDEIGDVSLELQTKLLRVLQEKTIERVGSSEPVKVDVRVLTATHQDLEGLIRQGRFREDLYYRLNVFPLVVPPLRERVEDIPELVLYFLRRCAQRCKKQGVQIDDDALSVLKGQPWPGNVRQLENAIARAVVLVEGPVVGVADLPAELVAAGPVAAWQQDNGQSPAGGLLQERQQRQRRERELILRALQGCGGNKAEAARALGLARSTLVSRLKKYGIE